MPVYWSAELDGSPVEEWTTERGFKATVRLMCNWDERNALACQILGYGGLVYPRLPATGARARSCRVERFEGAIGEEAAGFADYQYAILTIQYDTEGPSGDDLVSESLEPSAEFMTLDYSKFRWQAAEGMPEESGDPLRENEAPGKLDLGFEYKITFAQAPYIPSAVLTHGGGVNNQSVSSWTLGLTFEPETLLFKPPVASRKITTEQIEAWQLTYRFVYRSHGWNKFWRQKTQAWEGMWIHTGPGTGEGQIYKNFPLVDFSELFPTG